MRHYFFHERHLYIFYTLWNQENIDFWIIIRTKMQIKAALVICKLCRFELLYLRFAKIHQNLEFVVYSLAYLNKNGPKYVFLAVQCSLTISSILAESIKRKLQEPPV